MSNKWYIGQPIVVIKNSSCGNIKKGQEFTIKGLMSFCKCNDIIIDVGLLTNYNLIGCDDCNGEVKSNGILWKSEILFAPLDQDISELTDILKESIKEFIEK